MTTVLTLASVADEVVVVITGTPLPPVVRTAHATMNTVRANLERDFTKALQVGGLPDTIASTTLSSALGWHPSGATGAGGLHIVCSDAESTNPSGIASPRTCISVLPELIPLDEAGTIRVDDLYPIHRTISGCTSRSPKQMDADMSLAIVFTDGQQELFRDIAERVFQRLAPVLDNVRLVAGSAVTDGLYQVLSTSRAILFIGDSYLSAAGAGDKRRGGWMLTDQVHVSFDDIEGNLRHLPKVPELVVANCCSGSWRDPTGAEPYPQIFLKHGVRFFVGSWMDIYIRAGSGHDEDRGAMEDLLAAFLAGWRQTPDATVRHLFEAKEKRKVDRKVKGQPDSVRVRHPLTYLYQIYISATETVADRPTAGPTTSARPRTSGAVVGRLAPGFLVGDYRLGAEIWSDSYARTFWAEHEREKSVHLVQVLGDEWLGDTELKLRMERALEVLARLPTERHLVPNRYDEAILPSAGLEGLRLRCLIYDRPPGERADDWRSFAAWMKVQERDADGRLGEETLTSLISIGAKVARAMSDLATLRLEHGNLDASRILLRQQAPGAPIVLRDAWLRLVDPGRYVALGHVAPETPTDGPRPTRKGDTWALGFVLFESLTGGPPVVASQVPGREIITSPRLLQGDWVPRILDEVVRDCLVAEESMRPAPATVARRLGPAARVAPPAAALSYAGIFAEQLELRIKAGERLIYVVAEDPASVEGTLREIAHRTEVSLVVATEAGILDITESGVTEVGARDAFPDTEDLAAGDRLGGFLLQFLQGEPGDAPIVLVRGARWWMEETRDGGMRNSRVLRELQADAERAPLVVVTDTFLRIEESVAPYFDLATYPPLSGPEMLDEIKNFPERECKEMDKPSDDTTLDLARGLFPASRRGLRRLLRKAALSYGAFDNRLLGMHADDLGRYFAQLGVEYLSPARCAPWQQMAWPRVTDRLRMEDLASQLRAPGRADLVAARIAFFGAGGFGKSLAIQALAGRLGLPLLLVDGATVATRMGDGLHQVLSEASMLAPVVFAVDGLEPLVNPTDRLAVSAAGQLRAFAEALPRGVILLVTARTPPPRDQPWRRILNISVALDAVDIHETRPEARAFRRAIWQATWQRRGLPGPGNDEAVLGAAGELLSLPSRTGAGTPQARVPITSPSDIDAWVVDRLFDAAADQAKATITTPDYWRRLLAAA